MEFGGIVVEPFVVLAAIGFGLGAYVGDIGDLSYAEYLAPGLIASYAMFHATFDSTYGAYMRMDSHHVYEAMLFTPIGPSDIVLGEAMWGATRSLDGKPLAGFCATRRRRIQDLYGMVVHVIRCNTHYAIDNRR